MPNYFSTNERQRTSTRLGERGSQAISVSLAVIVLLFAGLWEAAAFAQAYPAKPIKLMVPYPPGGGADLATRVVAQKLSEGLGQQVIVESRGGAGGTITVEAAAKSPSDGYTLLLGTLSTLCIAPSLYRNLGYDPVQSFAPISLVGTSPSVLVINSSVPATTLRELIDLAKSRPGRLNFGSNGNGTLPHLAGELFKSLTGVEIVHVPYKGAAAVRTDLLAGQIQMTFVVSYGLEQLVRAGKLRVLAVASSRRLPQLPEVPTAAEAGLPGFETSTWWGLVAPQGTPPNVIQRLNAEMLRVLAAKDVRDTLSQQGFDAGGTSPEQFAQFIAAEIEKWSPIVKASGIRLD